MFKIGPEDMPDEIQMLLQVLRECDDLVDELARITPDSYQQIWDGVRYRTRQYRQWLVTSRPATVVVRFAAELQDRRDALRLLLETTRRAKSMRGGGGPVRE